MIKAVVGSGGKTTLIHRMAEKYLSEGKKVFVTTSTHMYIEKDTVISDNADEIISVMQDKGCVMAGTAETKDERKILYGSSFAKR